MNSTPQPEDTREELKNTVENTLIYRYADRGGVVDAFDTDIARIMEAVDAYTNEQVRAAEQRGAKPYRDVLVAIAETMEEEKYMTRTARNIMKALAELQSLTKEDSSTSSTKNKD